MPVWREGLAKRVGAEKQWDSHSDVPGVLDHVADAEQLLPINIPELQAPKILSNSKRWASLGHTPDMIRNPFTRIVANFAKYRAGPTVPGHVRDENVIDGIA